MDSSIVVVFYRDLCCVPPSLFGFLFPRCHPILFFALTPFLYNAVSGGGYQCLRSFPSSVFFVPCFAVLGVWRSLFFAPSLSLISFLLEFLCGSSQAGSYGVLPTFFCSLLVFYVYGSAELCCTTFIGSGKPVTFFKSPIQRCSRSLDGALEIFFLTMFFTIIWYICWTDASTHSGKVSVPLFSCLGPWLMMCRLKNKIVPDWIVVLPVGYQLVQMLEHMFLYIRLTCFFADLCRS
jgi:hypothetical protein